MRGQRQRHTDAAAPLRSPANALPRTHADGRLGKVFRRFGRASAARTAHVARIATQSARSSRYGRAVPRVISLALLPLPGSCRAFRRAVLQRCVVFEPPCSSPHVQRHWAGASHRRRHGRTRHCRPPRPHGSHPTPLACGLDLTCLPSHSHGFSSR